MLQLQPHEQERVHAPLVEPGHVTVDDRLPLRRGEVEPGERVGLVGLNGHVLVFRLVMPGFMRVYDVCVAKLCSFPLRKVRLGTGRAVLRA